MLAAEEGQRATRAFAVALLSPGKASPRALNPSAATTTTTTATQYPSRRPHDAQEKHHCCAAPGASLSRRKTAAFRARVLLLAASTSHAHRLASCRSPQYASIRRWTRRFPA
jgi:hypothetical protein